MQDVEETSKKFYKKVTFQTDLTPPEIYERLPGEKKFLLESTVQHETKGKYSFIGSTPYLELKGSNETTVALCHEKQTEQEINENPLTYLQKVMPKDSRTPPLPFHGGAIGYVGYDAIRAFEDIGKELPDDSQMPDIHLMLYKVVIVLDHRKNSIHLIATNPHDEKEEILDDRIEQLINALEVDVPKKKGLEELTFEPELSEHTFKEKIEQAKKHIEAGEVLQVVLSQRMTAKMNGDPFLFYEKLRETNPSPYMFYIDFKDYVLLGSSPESLIQVTGDTVQSNPIAGTRPRGRTSTEDEAFMKELLHDEKEIKEHEMLVTLSREDLEKVCEKESIISPTYMEIEKYEHVMHIVTELQGKLKKGASSIDALIACLPAGTVSGFPKVRAMQIINELEEKKRSAYGGGVGFINFHHDMNIALAIRSLIVKDGLAYLQAGAGIVSDSSPQKEYEETLHKSRSLRFLSK